MSNLFSPTITQDIQKDIPKTAPVKPALTTPPVGRPVPALQELGFSGGIGDFNTALQAVVDSHVQQFGYKPDPNTALHAAITTLPEQAPTMFTKTTPAPQVQTSPELLRSVIAFANNNRLDDWFKHYGDMAQAMLRDPKYGPQMRDAIAKAKNIETLRQRQAAGGGLMATEKWLALTGLKSAEKVAATTLALGGDTTRATEWLATGGKKGSISFPELTKTAPAVAQVVKGLVYSPVGIAQAVKAVSLDTKDAARGDFSFKRTAQMGKQMEQAFVQDISDPHNRAGYLALDIFGIGSLGVGTAARIGRAGAVLKEGETLGAASKAATAPHPLRTTTLSKNGFEEQISLAASPLSAWIQEFTPVVGTRATQARLSGVSSVAGTTLAGEPIESFRLLPNIVQKWSDRLFTEGRIGRAGNIRRITEYKAAMGLKAELDHAAGSAVASTRIGTAINKLTGHDFFEGLSRGEVKAFQALSWDDPHPLAAEERFHQSMIKQGIGDKAAHEEQIANLVLARKALENPSERFQKTLDAMARVTAATQAMRIQMGLGVDTAEARIAKAGAYLREEDLHNGEVVGFASPPERITETSWYTPTVPKGKPRPRNLAESPFQRALSVFGFGPPTGVNLFRHEMTGEALRAGNIRIDAHHLAGEGYARTVRAMQTIDEWKKAWDNGTKEPTSQFDIPVRDVREIPENLRESVSQFFDGHITAADAEGLPDEVHKWLFPKKIEEDDHVRYIDPRLLGNAAKPTIPAGLLAKFAEKVNNLMRPWILYGPKYALNKLGNQAMLVLDEGPWSAGQNLAKAHAAEDNLTPGALAKLKALTGAGRSESYVNPRSGRVGQGLADWWAKMTDNNERMASFLYYADRKGYKTWDDLERLLGDGEGVKADLVDISKRADDALVAFDRMSPWEKATLRHYIFVYPWQRGATIWSFRTVFEHPAKTAILATIGQEAYQNDDWLKTAVQWVRRTGYVPLYWGHDGNPIVADLTSVNTWSTLAQGLETLKAVLEGDKYASAGDLLGPPGQFVVHGILGVDQNGNKYPGSQWLGAAEETLNILPFVAAYKRNQKGAGKALPPFDVTNRASLQARLNAAIKQTVLSPGWLAGFGNIFAGGFSPRELNLNASAARYWADATPAQRHAREVDLLNRALNMQGEFLQRKVPTGVRAAVKDAAQLSWLATQEAKTLGHGLTRKQQLLLTIKYLKNAGRISDFVVADTLTAAASKLETVPDIAQMQSALMTKYGHLQDLHQWDADVRLVASLRDPVNFNSRVSGLFTLGLADQKLYRLSQAQREEYGRGYANYLDQRQKIQKAISAGTADKSELLAFDDSHDKPVNGLPSYPRFLFSEGSSDAQESRVAGLVSRSWGDLSRAEKAALGRDVSPKISEAWSRYNATVAAVRARDGSAAANQKLAIAKEANREYPGFMQDWLYAQQSRAARLERSPLADQFPAVFKAVLANAAKLGQTILKNGHRDYYEAAWKQYIANVIDPWLKNDKDGRQVADVLAPFGKRFLEGLVSS